MGDVYGYWMNWA